jgi:putative transcriptional regulator
VESTAGRLLIATPNLGDPNFDMTIVYVLEHNPDGALGVVVNRPTETPVAMHLPEFASLVSPPDVFFAGGPVATDTVLGVGQTDEGIALVDLEALGLDSLPPPTRLRLFAGYSGWAPHQLDGELYAGSWFVVDARHDDLFGPEPRELWRSVLRRQGGRLGRLALFPDSLMVN